MYISDPDILCRVQLGSAPVDKSSHSVGEFKKVKPEVSCPLNLVVRWALFGKKTRSNVRLVENMERVLFKDVVI